MARGEFLCLLNNDTLVTRGWLSTLIGHLRQMPERGAGRAGEQQVGNEAKVPVGYGTMAEMPRWADGLLPRSTTAKPCPSPCWASSAWCSAGSVYEQVGELDERFGIGCFEDDDYCRRVRRQGYEMRCARDAFVHHWQGASFRLMGDDRYADIYREEQAAVQGQMGRRQHGRRLSKGVGLHVQRKPHADHQEAGEEMFAGDRKDSSSAMEAAAALPPEDPQWTPFLCNVCGLSNYLPWSASPARTVVARSANATGGCGR